MKLVALFCFLAVVVSEVHIGYGDYGSHGGLLGGGFYGGYYGPFLGGYGGFGELFGGFPKGVTAMEAVDTRDLLIPTQLL